MHSACHSPQMLTRPASSVLTHASYTITSTTCDMRDVTTLAFELLSPPAKQSLLLTINTCLGVMYICFRQVTDTNDSNRHNTYPMCACALLGCRASSSAPDSTYMPSRTADPDPAVAQQPPTQAPHNAAAQPQHTMQHSRCILQREARLWPTDAQGVLPTRQWCALAPSHRLSRTKATPAQTAWRAAMWCGCRTTHQVYANVVTRILASSQEPGCSSRQEAAAATTPTPHRSLPPWLRA
ncbi:hypothetical protein COO60DRAFT_332005 [Scenedesmus sp. NREL 46B-D3]|nr:hypothetical protein COO60DRAFT_332005 [Scenedesmus sp. NREL 46B-D3]